MAHSRQAQDMEHRVSRAVVKTARWGLGIQCMCSDRLAWGDATCWTLEACQVASVAEPPACLLLCWQARPPEQVSESLLKPQGCDLLVSSLQSSLHNLFSAWKELQLSICKGMERREGRMSYFYKVMKKEKSLVILPAEICSYIR